MSRGTESRTINEVQVHYGRVDRPVPSGRPDHGDPPHPGDLQRLEDPLRHVDYQDNVDFQDTSHILRLPVVSRQDDILPPLA
jgi:hypothetical protein